MKVVLALAAALLLSGCSAGITATATPAPLPFHGREPLQPSARPAFALTDTSGAAYDFAAETAGKPTLLYFGYTHCPDECPTAMADIAGALRETPEPLRSRTQVVFVTTDPDRDTGPLLRRFLDQFSTEFVGLRGTQAQVDAAAVATGVAAAEKQGEIATLPGKPDQHVHAAGTAEHQHDGPLGYGVGHADTIFAFDTSDRLPVLYDGGRRPSDIAADLPLLAPGDNP